MKTLLQKGQAAILIIFLLGMIAVLIGVSQVKLGALSSFRGRGSANSLPAYYAANSGIEDAILQVQKDVTLGVSVPYSYTLAVGNIDVDVTVAGTEEEKTITSVTKNGKYIRRIKAIAWNSQTTPGFLNAIQADQGGVELEGNTKVSILLGYSGGGNVYSNSYIKGTKNSYDTKKLECQKSSSAINGSAWAVDRIDKLESSDSGVCITENAYSGSLNYCYVAGNVESPGTPGANCSYGGTYTSNSAPPIEELPRMGIDTFKDNFSGDIFNGDCNLDGTNSISDCSMGTYKLGNIKINGNLTINPKDPNKEVEISGPVWVTGNILITANTKIGVEKSIMDISQLVVADGTITSSAGVEFGINVNPTNPDSIAFLLFISTKPSAAMETDICKENDKDNIYNSIRLSSNTNSVLFYAMNGCVLVNANGTFQGAILGKKVRVITNSDIVYDPRLQTAVFGLSGKSGWQVSSFNEY
jgi:hypothetical protein